MSTIADAKEIAKKAGKTIVEVKEFNGVNDFDAVHRAKDFITEKGYRCGSMCLEDPIGFASCNYVAKWHNIPLNEYPKLEGVMVSKDFRKGSVKVAFFKD